MALALCKTVAEVECMTQREYNGWIEFYKLYPFDDLHRYQRPAALISSSMSGDLEKKLDWLAPDPSTKDYSQADMNTLKAFGFRKPGR